MRAVDGVALDLLAGHTLGIVGESGCGKSVTARTILRLIDRPGRIMAGAFVLGAAGGRGRSPDAGTRRARDARNPRRRDRVGLPGADVFASACTTPRQPDHRSGPPASPPVGRRHGRAAIDLLRQVGVPRPDRRIDAYPFQLSGGLRQRVMIALALAGEPRLLIADEPTTALDVTTQAQILALLRRLQRERGVALMLITHDMGVIAEMADDVRGDVSRPHGRVRAGGRTLPRSPATPTRERCCARCRA